MSRLLYLLACLPLAAALIALLRAWYPSLVRREAVPTRRERAVVALCVALGVVAVYGAFLAGDALFAYRDEGLDTVDLYVPFYLDLLDSLRDGTFGAWNFDSGEEIFLNKVKEVVGDDLVINDPMDGSFLAYGFNGLRVYNRNFVGYDGSRETAESELIRTRLCDIATDDGVREAVDKIGARYVIVMRQDDSEWSLINQRGDFKPELFSGISSIGPDTPGFTRVLRYGTMSLYRIDGAS